MNGKKSLRTEMCEIGWPNKKAGRPSKPNPLACAECESMCGGGVELLRTISADDFRALLCGGGLRNVSPTVQPSPDRARAGHQAGSGAEETTGSKEAERGESRALVDRNRLETLQRKEKQEWRYLMT